MLHNLSSYKKFSKGKKKNPDSGNIMSDSTKSFKMKKPEGYSFEDCMDPRKNGSKGNRNY